MCSVLVSGDALDGFSLNDHANAHTTGYTSPLQYWTGSSNPQGADVLSPTTAAMDGTPSFCTQSNKFAKGFFLPKVEDRPGSGGLVVPWYELLSMIQGECIEKL